MQISQLKTVAFDNAYGIECALIPTEKDRAAIYPTFARISPGNKTIAHSHFETEIFYIIQGQGLMTIINCSTKVCAGDLIRIPASLKHELKNIGEDELILLSIYSEDFETQTLPKEVIITSAPPTPNGPLHLGHISGPYLASDILARYLKLRKVSVRTSCGTDDHQNYVAERSRQRAMSIESFRTEMRATIQAGFSQMNIGFNEFVEPAKDKYYQEIVHNFMQRAIKSEVIEKESVNFPYCTYCNNALIDASIIGTCPYCYEETHGACENCGMVVPPYLLLHATCACCKRFATPKYLNIYTFNLTKHLPALQIELQKYRLSPQLQKLIDKTYQIKNLKMMITHPSTYNIGVMAHDINQVIHVWFEMAAHYEKFALDNREWIHCFGFDNSFYYLLFIPAILRAMNPQTKLPNSIITNEFLQLDGQKFSTSRRHAIWVNQLEYNVDHLRLYLSLNRPASTQSNFALEPFLQFSTTLGASLNKLNQRAEIVALLKHDAVHLECLIDCNRFTRHLENYLRPNHLDLRRAGRELMSLIDFAMQSLESGNSEKLILHTLALLMTPFMPNESERLFKSLKLTSHSWVKDWSCYYALV